MNEPIDFTDSSGNVFTDLGLPNSEERLLKADLALQIKQLLEVNGLAPAAAAALLHIPPPGLKTCASDASPTSPSTTCWSTLNAWAATFNFSSPPNPHRPHTSASIAD